MDANIIFVILDIEQGLRGVLDFPHDDGRDFDGVAALVVDLKFLRIEIAGAQRNFISAKTPWAGGAFGGFTAGRGLEAVSPLGGLHGAIGVERISPMKAGIAHGAFIFAEQNEDSSFIRLKGKKTREQNDCQRLEQDGENEHPPDWMVVFPQSVNQGVDEETDRAQENGDEQREHKPAVTRVDNPFASGR